MPSARMPTIPNIDLVSRHDEVYDLWKARGVYQATLLHFDQHSDFKWLSDENDPLKDSGKKISQDGHRFLSLSHYLTRAFQEKLVQTWYWVIPDPIWSSSYQRYELWAELLNLYKIRTGPMELPKIESWGFTTSFWGVKTIVTSLDQLPQNLNAVILNVDIDFFSTSTTLHVPKLSEVHKQVPWIWPDEFYTLIKQKNYQYLNVSIFDSVSGGLTPVSLKFLGDALKSLFKNGESSANYAALKEILLPMKNQTSSEILTRLNLLHLEGIYEATRLFFKSHLLMDSDHRDQAIEDYAEVIKIDSEFRLPQSCYALHYESEGRYREAFFEYAKMQKILPDEVWPWLGGAKYFLRSKDYPKAVQIYQDILKRDPASVEALGDLGQIYFQFSQPLKALEFFAEAKRLEPFNPKINVQLGETFLKLRRYKEARTVLSEVLKSGWIKPAVYFLLSDCEFRKSHFNESWEFYKKGLWQQFLIWCARAKALIGYLKNI